MDIQVPGFNTQKTGIPPIGGKNTGSIPPKSKNQIVTELYQTVLGRSPDPNSLMYYISQPQIDEDMIRKQMVNSNEHKHIIKEFQNISVIKKELENSQNDISALEKKVKDKEVEIEELNHILHHQSQELSNIKRALPPEHKLHEQVAKEIAEAPTNLLHDGFFKKILRNILYKLPI